MKIAQHDECGRNDFRGGADDHSTSTLSDRLRAGGESARESRDENAECTTRPNDNPDRKEMVTP